MANAEEVVVAVANGGPDETQKLDMWELRQTLLSNSTKRRSNELHSIHEKLINGDFPTPQVPALLHSLLDTYPLYIDGRSRQAVENCLAAIAGIPETANVLAGFVRAVETESNKAGNAPGNAFVLVRWSSLFIQHAAKDKAVWDSWGFKAVAALTNALNILLASNPKESTRDTALRVSRRAFRILAKSSFGPDALTSCITTLSAKAATPITKHALPLGIIAGVCSRLPDHKTVVEAKKADYFAFYLREFLGSKVQLPAYIANALHDFFDSYVSAEDLKKEVVPAVEKSLLRAPEVVLNDLVAPVILALPKELDLSDILASNLTKPLLANIKSTKPEIREGAVRTFKAVASRSHEEKLVEKAADEILTPLKGGKVTAADQRVLHADMLAALAPTSALATKVPAGLVPVASKEANEPAAQAEISCIVKYARFALESQLKLENATIDAFAKGLAEKRLPMRRVWALQLADLIWSISPEVSSSETAVALLDASIPKLVDIFTEVHANPIPALQNGQIPAAAVATALTLARASALPALESAATIKKAAIGGKVLSLEPKPSFLLNPRIYAKLATEDDLRWFLHAVIAAFPSLTTKNNKPVSTAWAQALIYLITSPSVPAKVRNEASRSLQGLYIANAETTSNVIVAGLWQWCEDLEVEAKDSAATTSRAGRDELHKVVRAISLDVETAAKLGTAVLKDILEAQLKSLLVLCRPQLIPKTSWIQTCLRTGTDPGSLVESSASSFLQQILTVTEHPVWKNLPTFQLAACYAAADLAFVAPNVFTPILVQQIRADLDPSQLNELGPTEAAIYRTPEGTAFIDVLSKQSQAPQISKNQKDYDTLKWEEELRAQLAAKKGQTKKLTADEQAKVKAQLQKESEIRQKVATVDAKLRRGIGFIGALATGPPTEAEEWFGPSVKLLFDVIQAGAGLILGDAASLGYLQCSDKISTRLGPIRPFVGVATLRSAGITMLPENLLAEPLGDLVTRILYRLRSLGEQRPFDTVSLSYILPLVFLVLENGGIDRANPEDAAEQLMLATEVISFHTETCADPRLPRQGLLESLIVSLQKYPQHFKEIKDCFADLARHLSANMSETETDTVVRGTIVPETSVRNAVLQAISAELELTDREFYEEIWLANHDDDLENSTVAREIWEENELRIIQDGAAKCLPYLESKDSQLRRAAARAAAAATKEHSSTFGDILSKLQSTYVEAAKPKKPELDRYGMPLKKDMSDPWEARHGIALAFRELAAIFPEDQIAPFLAFLIESGPLSDKNGTVRDSMVDAATAVVSTRGKGLVEPLMKLCEDTLGASSKTPEQDLVNEAVVILYGALARHLPKGDDRVPKVVNRLLSTLSTPSESVQYAVAQCLPPLVRASTDQASAYLKQLTDETLHAKKYAARRGAAYGLAGVIKGRGISLMKETRLLSTLRSATENKKDVNERQGAFLAYELLSLLLGPIFEPYVIQIVPQLLGGFGDASADVRDACLDAAKTCFASLSSYGVKLVLPQLLEGLDEQAWRSKKGACDSLGAMAYLDANQLAVSLPEIIPPLTEVLNDSHKEVRLAANRSLQRFGEVIENPEIKSQVSILLKALSDPTKYTDDALDALIKINFLHFIDAPSLALVVRILERGLGDRSGTKRKAAQIIGSLAHLTERKDLIAHLPILVAGLREAVVDPVPTTRATASKALGSTIEKLGEDALPDLIPSLMTTLKSDTGAGDRLGSAQALSEVLAGLGTGRLEETLPTILQNVASNKSSVREGFMSLFIFLPACFGQSFANYLARIIPSILAGLADDVESIRETALRAGRLLVKNFASKSVDLLLPELERGLADDSYRIRLSSVELIGDLLFNLTGVSGTTEAEDLDEGANEAGANLLEILGEEKRNRVLAALYICRMDTSGLVRTSAMNVWKALVSSPRILKDLIPILTQLLVKRLASSNSDQKIIAGNALGELIRKAGDGVLSILLPTLEEHLQNSSSIDSRTGICIALRELIAASTQDSLMDHQQRLVAVLRTALVDTDEDVRDAAADAFDSLQRLMGKRAIDQVLPYLLQLLRDEGEAANALQGLLTLLTDSTRSNIILPNLLPTLIASPISAFNARALASLAEVASSAMTRKLPNILNALMDNIVACKSEDLKTELDTAFDTIILSVDEYDGLNTMMSVMLSLSKNDDHRRRASADMHFAAFFERADLDFSRYYPDLIRAMLISFDDSDSDVTKAAWTALSQLMQRLRKEEMESLVTSTRQTLNQVGVAGHPLPGFSLPKGINAILPIFLQGLMNGSAEQRIQAALGLSDLIDRTSPDGLKPFVTQITGPLIRVVSERSVELKAAILLTLNNLLERIPLFLKPFLPQLQRTFAKSLADPGSEVLRSRAARALGTLITMTPRIDPLIAELVTGSKTSDAGVKNAMLKALYEVVSKAGAKMSEVSQNAILGLIDSDSGDDDDALNITYAKLLGALIAVIPAENTIGLIKARVLNYNFTRSTALALNAVLVEAPERLTSNLDEIAREVLVRGINHAQPFISDNAILAAGKYLLTETGNKSFEGTKPVIQALADVLPLGKPVDTRRLALVVIRTVARENSELIRPHLNILVTPIFRSVRDPVIPVKLSAEAAFLQIFDVVEEESAVFDKYLASSAGQALAAQEKRSMQEYFKRIALRLSSQARERKEAEGGAGGLGLTSDEKEDEREVWSIGKVDLGDAFADE
ncbi:Putative armadillo-like helical, translational activator Gcn1, TOG domain-containing protein [Septoria linicola]|uniref:eIF-2-alpha kinase activator GCN1 n=1 Tax=Septoria linicola TaxID=215465 RepID=A0A9Q9ENI0_9PEZI|nr:putative armadillo-like helical, translational activator Gcn1, TOG domain-containing protein [Septoria linicola]USW56642.1 Putative armadillo-like helical, translational activator Gcn1, TOG domain-containing protein [Septoria linicola]